MTRGCLQNSVFHWCNYISIHLVIHSGLLADPCPRLLRTSWSTKLCWMSLWKCHIDLITHISGTKIGLIPFLVLYFKSLCSEIWTCPYPQSSQPARAPDRNILYFDDIPWSKRNRAIKRGFQHRVFHWHTFRTCYKLLTIWITSHTTLNWCNYIPTV